MQSGQDILYADPRASTLISVTDTLQDAMEMEHFLGNKKWRLLNSVCLNTPWVEVPGLNFVVYKLGIREGRSIPLKCI